MPPTNVQSVPEFAYDPSQDSFFLASSSMLYTLDVTNGATTLVGPFFGAVNNPNPETVIEIAINSAGDLYCFSIAIDSLFLVDKTSGESTVIGATTNDASFIQGMDFDPDTDIFYHSMYTSGGTGQYGTWDVNSAVFTPIVNLENLPADGDGYELKLAIRPMITSTCSDPASFIRFRGNDVGTPAIGDFAGPDGTTASYTPGFTINNDEAPVWLIFDYAATASNEVQVTSQAGTPGLEMTVE